MADERIVFKDVIMGDFDWVDDDLNPILPKDYLKLLDENHETSFELRYDALINGKSKITEYEYERMVMFFKMEKDYDKVTGVHKAFAKQQLDLQNKVEDLIGKEKISKDDQNFLDDILK